MRQLGAGEFETAVVAIGTEVEASILTTAVSPTSAFRASSPRR